MTSNGEIPKAENLPSELLRLNRFVVWREEKRGKKLVKIPCAPWRTGHWGPASATDPDNWTDFETAVGWAEKKPDHGVGFVLGDGVVGIDLDGCIDENGNLTEFANELLHRAGSYAELSPSAHGIHILVRGRLDQAIKRDDIGLEVYPCGRFFTLTGRRWKHAPLEIRENQTLLDELREKFGREVRVEKGGEGVSVIEIMEKLAPEGLKALKKRGKNLQGPHPVHGSTTGWNFSINLEKNSWFCYRHWTGGGPFSLVGILGKIIQCEDVQKYGGKYPNEIGDRISELARKHEIQFKGKEALTVDLGKYTLRVLGKNAILHDQKGDPVEVFPLRFLTAERAKEKIRQITGIAKEEIGAKMAQLILKLEENENEEKDEGELDIKPVFESEWKAIHPALDFLDGVAYIGVQLPCEVGGNGNPADLRDFHFLITSERERILGRKKELAERRIKLAHRVITFPNRWSLDGIRSWLDGGKIVEKTKLYRMVRSAFEDYMEFQDETDYDFLTLWTIGTYVFPIFGAYPYVFIGGIKGVGKTKLLTLLSLMAFNAIFSGNLSSAALFRLIQSGRATVLLDESEKLDNPERAQELRCLLLNGYKRGGLVYRVNKDTGRPEPFEVYSPKAIANIRGLEDILEDRCVSIVIVKGKTDVIDREPEIEDPRWEKIRDALYTFALTHHKRIVQIKNEIGKLEELRARSREIWLPILTLAKFFDEGRGLYDRILKYAIQKEDERLVENITETREYLLVQALTKLVQSKKNSSEIYEDGYLPVHKIKDALAEYFDGEQRWLTSRWIGKALRRLGFKDKRRVGTGYEYLIPADKVSDLAERLQIRRPLLQEFYKVLQRLAERRGEFSEDELISKCKEAGIESPRPFIKRAKERGDLVPLPDGNLQVVLR